MQPTDNSIPPPPRDFIHAWLPRFLLVLVVVCFGRWLTATITDDALITYRYGANLAAGHGLVYNIGERVLGTTTPLYAILMGGLSLLGIYPWWAGLVIEVLSLTTAILLVAHWLGKTLGPTYHWAFLFLCLHNPLHITPMAGMETGLFAALVLLTLFAMNAGRLRPAIALATLLPFLRPEGVLIGGLLAVGLLIKWKRGEKIPFAFIVGCSILFALIVAALWSYYGSPLPNSVRAKQVQGGFQSWGELFAVFHIREQFRPHSHFYSGWGFFMLGGMALLLTKPSIRWLAIWFLVYLTFMLVGRAPNFPWYADAITLVRMALISSGACWLVLTVIDKVTLLHKITHQSRWYSVMIAAISLLLIIAAAPGFSWNWYRMIAYFHERQEGVLAFKHFRKAGEWLHANSKPDDEIFTPEIGYIGYFSQRKIYDPVGLVSPEALKDYGRITFWQQAIERKSEWVVYGHSRHGDWKFPTPFATVYTPAESWIDNDTFTVVFKRTSADFEKDAPTTGTLKLIPGGELTFQ